MSTTVCSVSFLLSVLTVLKASQMGHIVWFLFGMHLYQPTLDFAFFTLEWTIVKCIWCYNFTDNTQNGWC